MKLYITIAMQVKIRLKLGFPIKFIKLKPATHNPHINICMYFVEHLLLQKHNKYLFNIKKSNRFIMDVQKKFIIIAPLKMPNVLI